MASIVLLDDEPQSLSRIRDLVEACGPDDPQRSITEVSSFEELSALQASGHAIDILVSDIVMGSTELSGIDVVERLFPPGSSTQVIFVSGHLEQALEVYRADHVYFLLKPIDQDKLQSALRKAYDNLGEGRTPMLRIGTGRRERLIATSSIRYLESDLRKVIVHCQDQSFETRAKLDDLQTQLPPVFSRCHRSYLVNLNHVSHLGEGELQLFDGTTLPVSRRRRHQVQHDLLSLLQSR